MVNLVEINLFFVFIINNWIFKFWILVVIFNNFFLIFGFLLFKIGLFKEWVNGIFFCLLVIVIIIICLILLDCLVLIFIFIVWVKLCVKGEFLL